MTAYSCTSTTYIAGTASAVWHALTDADATEAWWEHRNVSDWQVGSPWEHRAADGNVDGIGEVLVSQPGKVLDITFPPAGDSRVRFDLDGLGPITRLVMTHTDLPDANLQRVVATVWAAVLSNLKTYVETGTVMPASPLARALALLEG